MLTIKVNWGLNSEGHPFYSVFTADKYTVDVLGWSGDSKNGSKPSQVRLLLDDDKHDILLGLGTKTYVMNPHGSTIDTIIVY